MTMLQNATLKHGKLQRNCISETLMCDCAVHWIFVRFAVVSIDGVSSIPVILPNLLYPLAFPLISTFLPVCRRRLLATLFIISNIIEIHNFRKTLK